MPTNSSKNAQTEPYRLGDTVCICPEHRQPLVMDATGEPRLGCGLGCSFEIKDGIPRFVPSDMYAAGFGLQWKAFRKTQLDSYCGIPIANVRLTRLLGGSLDVVRGKKVLEAGCGAGRFTEILLNAGARVTAIDLSIAVEANRDNFSENFKHRVADSHYNVSQASILKLPFAPEQFDVVICAGVVQHTPCPEETIAALCSQVKPGGLLAIDHYTHWPAPTRVREVLRKVLTQVPAESAFAFVTEITELLWPAHEYFYNHKNVKEMENVWHAFLQMSPLVDLQLHSPPFQDPALAKDWTILCTHDTLTDFYKHLRTAEEIAQCLADCAMTGIQTDYAGNGVEARAMKPVADAVPEEHEQALALAR